MRLCDVGWVWEGQGLDPGVHPSIFGVGEGAEFFGLRKVHFMFHPTNELALEKLSDKEEVVCDISKWRFVDTDKGGTEHYVDASPEAICAEAESLSKLSLAYPNVTGAYFDDMKGLMERHGHESGVCASIHSALKKHNPNLRLDCVVYTRELSASEFWKPLVEFVDVVCLWVWGYENLATLEDDFSRCQDLFPDKPILMGCYLRDYPTAAPMPMDAIRRQWEFVLDGVQDGRLAGFDILGTILIDGQLDQARWIRDFIRANS